MMSKGLSSHARRRSSCQAYKGTAGSRATPGSFVCCECVVEETRKNQYLTRTFWSPDHRYLVTVHVVGGQIETLQDDNGREWQAAGEQQDINKVA